MKRIFVPLILIVTIATGGVLAYAMWKASPVTSKQFFDSGKNYYDQKKYSDAAVQFLNAIQKDGRNRDARYFLALTYVSLRNINGAAQQLISLLEYFPDDIDANLALGNVYLTGGASDANFYRQAKETAETVLAKQPENVTALVLLGNALAGLQDFQASEELFGKVITLDPQNTSALVTLSAIKTMEKDLAGAEKALVKAYQLKPNDKTVLLALANFYVSAGDSNKAESLIKEALANYAADKDVYLVAVQFYYKEKRFDDLAKVLRDAQEKGAKDSPDALLTLADIYRLQNRVADERKVLFETKQKFPENTLVQAKIAESYLQDEPARARTEIDQILKSDPKNPLGHVLLGQLQFSIGQYDAAEATLATDPAINSRYPQPHFILGNLAAKRGQLDAALDHYQKSLAVNGQYLPARSALAEVFLNRGLLADCREEIRKVLEVRPDFVPGRIVQAELDIADKRYPEAEQELTALLQQQPNSALLHRQMARLNGARGRKAEAEKSFLRALELQPGSEEILQDLNQFYIAGKQIDRAVQALNSIPDDKKKPLHYELIGMDYFESGKLQDAERAFKTALDKDPGRSNADVYLAALYLQSGRMDDGIQQLDRLLKKDPNNASAYATKAAIYQNQGKINEAKQNYSQALKLNPNFDSAANNLAYILADEGSDLNTALSLAQLARRSQPDSPNAADTLGWVYYKLGNQVMARDQLQFAVSKQPENAAYQYHLGMIYKETKQLTEAQTALRKAVASSQPFKEKPLAETALRQISR